MFKLFVIVFVSTLIIIIVIIIIIIIFILLLLLLLWTSPTLILAYNMFHQLFNFGILLFVSFNKNYLEIKKKNNSY